MKTLSELNKKWWWRLLKGGFVVFVGFLFILSLIAPMPRKFNPEKYSPKKLDL